MSVPAVEAETVVELVIEWVCGYCQSRPTFGFRSELTVHMQNVHRIFIQWVDR